MKRSNGEGTIYKRNDGRWCASYFDDAPFPKRHYVYGRTKKEVKQKLEEKNNTNNNVGVINKVEVIGNTVKVVKESYTLEEWVMIFLENYKKNEVKPSTYISYVETYQKHIKNSLIGKVKLANITLEQLQIFFNEKLKAGYNPKTVKHVHVLINSALEKAVRLHYISENVNRYVTLPKKPAFMAKTLSSEEVKYLIENAKEDPLYPIVMLTIFTGLRKGEVMALKWKNINWKGRELRIEGSLCRVATEEGGDGRKHCRYEILEPKTVKSKRTVPLMNIAIEALKLQKERQNQIKNNVGIVYCDEDLVFTEYDGTHLKQRGFMNDYHAFLGKYGISQVRFHDLRHTFATFLLEAGESPKVIQELLGHSTITTTMDTYAHVSKEGKVKAIEKFGLII